MTSSTFMHLHQYLKEWSNTDAYRIASQVGTLNGYRIVIWAGEYVVAILTRLMLLIHERELVRDP